MFTVYRQKHVFLILLLITVGVCLSGCQMKSSSSRIVLPESTVAPSGAPATSCNTGPLQMVTSPVEFSLKGNGNNTGYYYLQRGEEISANMRYIDYSTSQDIYLSSRLTENHQTASDESYVASVAGSGVIFPADEILFLMRTGAPDYTSEFGTDALAGIYTMELNGTNRKQIYTGRPDEILMTTVATDHTSIYCISLRPEMLNGQPVQCRYLVKIDKFTGASQELCKLTDSAWMIGAFDDTLVFHSIYVTQEKSQIAPAMEHEIFIYSCQNNSLSVIHRWEEKERSVAVVSDEKLIVASAEKQNIIVQDIISGKTLSTYSIASFLTAENNTIWFEGCRDNRFYFWDLANQKLCFTELSTGTNGSVDLTYFDPEKQEQRPVEIYAQTETQYLVCKGMELVTREFIGKDGTLQKTQSTQPVFALINKEDYWGSKPLYTDVTSVS